MERGGRGTSEMAYILLAIGELQGEMMEGEAIMRRMEGALKGEMVEGVRRKRRKGTIWGRKRKR